MNGFEVAQHNSEDGITILRLKGFLDAHTAGDLEAALQKCIDEKKIRIVVNFEELNYISSAGLGVFMGFIEDVRENGGDIKMTSMTEKIFHVFDLLGFPALYDILKTDDEAVERFAQTEKE